MRIITILFLLLLLAALLDALWGKIPNWLNITGYLVGVVFTCYTLSFLDAIQRIVVSLVIFICMYLLFAIGCMGAGDVKLLMVLSMYASLKEFLVILMISFVLAAAFSLCKMIKYNILWLRLALFASYLQKCVQSRKVLPYVNSVDAWQAKIHMAGPIFIGYCIWASQIQSGGIYF